MEGDLGQLLGVVQEMNDAMAEMGCPSVISQIKIYYDPEGAASMDVLLEKYPGWAVNAPACWPPLIVTAAFLLLWQAAVWLFGTEPTSCRRRPPSRSKRTFRAAAGASYVGHAPHHAARLRRGRAARVFDRRAAACHSLGEIRLSSAARADQNVPIMAIGPLLVALVRLRHDCRASS